MMLMKLKNGYFTIVLNLSHQKMIPKLDDSWPIERVWEILTQQIYINPKLQTIDDFTMPV